MERLRFHVRLLALYFAQYAKARLSYRADFITSVFATFAGTAASLAVVLILFSRFPHLQGWSFPEIVFLYGFSLLPYGLFNVLSVNLYEFSDKYLTEGRFDRILLRPVAPLFQILFETFRIEFFQEVVTGSACVLWAASKLGGLRLSDIVLLPLWAVFGATIYLSVFAILTATGFWIEDRIGLAPPVFNLISFGRYPITIYDMKIRILLSTAIPFAFASFYPTARALRHPEFLPLFWATPFVAALFAGLAVATWNSGIKRYGSTGS
ncbi:MAG TPA: ABC-2 family transporter protein [Thermoanaerobaculia bacterium]|nr:ABC-2 family transporter protein [Thermoanaerobaculia bacterium]